MEEIQKTHGESALNSFFIQELEDIYWAEKYMARFLPQIRDAATSEELESVIADHISETEKQVNRLENIFELLGVEAKSEKCEAIVALFSEVQKAISKTQAGTSTRDAALIIGGQKIEHYEIATYGGLVQLATTLGFEQITHLLERNLQEEKDTDILYSDLAEKKVNWLAETEETK